MSKDKPEYCLTEYGKQQVQENIALAYYLANKFRAPYGMDHEDWKAECMEVLCLAVARYSPARGYSLSTLADRLAWLRRGNINVMGRTKRVGYGVLTTSLNQERGSDGPNLGQLCSYTDPGFEQVERADLVSAVIAECSPRGAAILQRLAEDVSLPDIGAGMGYSRQWASQTLFEVRQKLTRKFPDEVRLTGACKSCGGPLVKHSNKCQPMYCLNCAGQIAKAKKRQHHKINQDKNNKKRRKKKCSVKKKCCPTS
jgi:hypothetical protein